MQLNRRHRLRHHRQIRRKDKLSGWASAQRLGWEEGQALCWLVA